MVDLPGLYLSVLPALTDLDLAFNAFQGNITTNCLPKTLERLDVSGNVFDRMDGLVDCPSLLKLNASRNVIRVISHLPPKLVDLDISYNQLCSVINLRLLSLCPSITAVRVEGNPLSANQQLCRVTVLSVLPNCQYLDGAMVAGRRSGRANKDGDLTAAGGSSSSSNNTTGGTGLNNSTTSGQRSKSASKTRPSSSSASLQISHAAGRFHDLSKNRRKAVDEAAITAADRRCPSSLPLLLVLPGSLP